MSHKNVEYEVQDHAAWLTMSRPEALNALSKGMFRELEASLRSASKERGISSIVIKGEGRAFSAGLDVKEVSGFASRREAREFVYNLVEPFWKRFLGCEKPIISMVDGPAFGAAIAKSKVIFIPSGRYRVTNTIRLKPDTVLIGLNPITTQIAIDDAAPRFIGASSCPSFGALPLKTV